MKPKKITIRAYDVGFGDCFLLTFYYSDTDKRSVLIDFGSTGMPKNAGPKRMKDIAADIKNFVDTECDGVLHGVVATHRHKDHISGFSDGTGEIIEGLKPKVVIQPWTEDPKAQKDAKSATKSHASLRGAPKSLAAMQRDYMMALDNMNAFSEATLKASSDRMGVTTKRKIDFIADDNIANRSAVERLARMGDAATPEYVRAGDRTKLEQLLGGVKIHILGPPDLTQTQTILKQRSRDEDEFWHFLQFWSLMAVAEPAAARGASVLFPKARVSPKIPSQTRWFIDRADRLQGSQLLSIVRILDKAMNNTSVILLIEVGEKKLLFPGDAQMENWAFALSDPKIVKKLSTVNVYKVGHHGSLNATPRQSLWENFSRRSRKKSEKDRLITVVSTMKGKHGDTGSKTEVPRRSLVDELTAESDFHNTEALTGGHLFEPVEINV